ncbi:FMN-dependent NADH-azoreductase [Silvibacterium dinghuense]|uniref:FMN dependent NADH:quinone oxidoreductase n=1 Tax=Silvibacterium dinghuense TaxID=1560006 RepID=A0A4Q1SA73_9BACT|nr:NAD(P)H-dependent oxidoreductase [Silvibacterium dinghuense]RXS93887.1 FMN-dependent NADH-azoreductase [Silvibacterium dinghuense]GGH08505.1 FMN-dependent NADH-azoreductase [Silvibacterium dinghuense]
MSVLLRVDSSPMFAASVSRHLTDQFVEKWSAKHHGGQVVTRDLNKTELKPLTAEWVAAAYTPEEARTPEQKQLLALSDELVAEIEKADELVIGLPMHNFSIAGVTKLWIDLIARVGKTFSYGAEGPKGLLKNKKITFLVATGGKYDPGTAYESFNFVEPYVRTVFAFLGVTDVKFITAGGTAALRNPETNRESFLQPYEEAVAAHLG